MFDDWSTGKSGAGEDRKLTEQALQVLARGFIFLLSCGVRAVVVTAEGVPWMNGWRRPLRLSWTRVGGGRVSLRCSTCPLPSALLATRKGMLSSPSPSLWSPAQTLRGRTSSALPLQTGLRLRCRLRSGSLLFRGLGWCLPHSLMDPCPPHSSRGLTRPTLGYR